jgi:cyclic beta-1,2-glucan synthetase
MYRAGLEWILGFHLRGATLLLDPLRAQGLAKLRNRLSIPLRALDIAIENPHGVSRGVDRVEIDSKPLPGNLAQIPLVDDGMTHRVRVVLGVPMLSSSDALKAMASMDRGAK